MSYELTMTSCADCRFYRENSAHTAGTCHRRAPQATAHALSGRPHDTYWPTVLPDDACGEGEGRVRSHFPMRKEKP